MAGYSIDLEEKALLSNHYREVLYTTPKTQLVIMALQPGQDIGRERHKEHDQFVRIESGKGIAVLDGEKHPLYDGVALVIPAGVEHNVINTSESEPLKLYTIYSPPEHPDQSICRTKAEANANEEHHAMVGAHL